MLQTYQHPPQSTYSQDRLNQPGNKLPQAIQPQEQYIQQQQIFAQTNQYQQQQIQPTPQQL
jgi:hypothetical protein